MSEIQYLLRLQSLSDKEFKVSALTITDTPTKFVSQVSHKRKKFVAYNNSHSNSGELYLGDASVASSVGYPLPKTKQIELLIDSDLDVYFVADSGETGDLRVFEGA